MGLTETASAFWDTKGLYHSGLINISLYDLHDLYTKQELTTIISKIPPWQAEFRIYGRPSAGAGAVFAGILKSSFTYPEMPNPPAHWKRLAACDIGFQDDFVVMFGAEDPGTGEIWVYDEMTFQKTDAIIIANAVKAKQQGYIPLMMPQDAKFERGLGTTFQKIFKDAGCIVCQDLAANWRLQVDGKNKSIAPGIMFIRDIMQKGLFKMTAGASLFFKEFELYSYGDDGRFKDKHNHAVDTCRYLTQSLGKYGISADEAKQGKANEVSRNEWHDYNEEFEGY